MLRVETVVTNHELTFIGNLRGHSGNKFQIIHPLLFVYVLPRPVANLTFCLIEGEPVER